MIAGRYTLEREIGRGGMGAVWLARDEVLGRPVALKRVGLIPGVDTPDLRRAEREARLAARLNHPHVVAVYDLVTEGDEQWLVMEYVAGSTLAQIVQQGGPLHPDRAAPILRKAADALTAAHAAGIVHRDVKPSNILVGPEGEARLSDFGIARAQADATLTQAGLVTGSPAYLAPEVASGRHATEASDVWSLGATLFHALAGRAPYEVGDNVLGAMYRIVHEEPPRLADAGWLGPVLEATMTREPADRWPMHQVRDFLATRPGAPAVAPTGAVPSDSWLLEPAPDSTRMLAPAPSVAAPARPRAGQRSRQVPRALIVLVVALVVGAVAVLSWVAFDAGRGAEVQGAGEPRAGGSTHSQGSPATPRSSAPSSPSSPSVPGVTATGMERFVEGYLATVTSDPKDAWSELTPDFQAASGGYGQYKKFWDTIRSATVASFEADPQRREVSYTVDYVHADGSRSTDEVSLTLAGTDGRYLIAGES